MLVVPSDKTGVGKFRSVAPHVYLQEHYGDLFDIDISEVSTTTIVTNQDGDEEYGDDVFTDDISKFLTHQVFGSCDGFCRR